LEAVNQLRIAELRSAGQDKQGAEIQTKIAADRAASDAAFIELANIIEERRQSALTDDEKAIEALQIEIDENAKLKTALQETGKVYEGVQLLINDLVEQRDTVISKIEEEVEVVDMSNDLILADELAKYERMGLAAEDYYKAVATGREANATAAVESNTTLIDTIKENYDGLALGVGAVYDSMTGFADAYLITQPYLPWKKVRMNMRRCN